jgi:uncharacterized DUF497 family protein
VVLVAHTYWEEDGEDVIRIISARKATTPERRAYEEGYQGSGKGDPRFETYER